MFFRRSRDVEATAAPSSPVADSPSTPDTPETADVADLGGIADAADIDELRELMRVNVIDPELGVNIVDLGLVYDISVVDRVARVEMTLTTPGCPLSGYMTDAIQRTLPGRPGVDDTNVDIVWEPPWSPQSMSDAAKAALGWMG